MKSTPAGRVGQRESVEAGVEMTSAQGERTTRTVIARQKASRMSWSSASQGIRNSSAENVITPTRVLALEGLGEALGAPLLLLRVTDYAHDPGQGALRGVLRHLDLQHAGAVEGTGETASPDSASPAAIRR